MNAPTAEGLKQFREKLPDSDNAATVPHERRA